MKAAIRLLVYLIALASVLGVGAGLAASGPQAGLSRQVAGGGVTVAATLLKDRTDSTAIRLVLDTHSASLDGYQFDTIAILRDDQGKTYALEAVESASGSGHHRQAVLRFARAEADAKAVELIVKDVAGVKERTFRWSMAD
jgi:hypothetical protein